MAEQGRLHQGDIVGVRRARGRKRALVSHGALLQFELGDVSAGDESTQEQCFAELVSMWTGR